MGRRGPKPKPSALKVIQGTFRPDRAPANEPKPEVVAPEAPKLLTKDARAEWDRLVPQLLELGLLSAIDRDQLAGYCAALAVWAQAERDIKKHGAIIKTPFGLKNNPAVMNRFKAWEHIRRFGALFGLSPADRTRVNAEKNQKEPKAGREKNPLAKFLRHGEGVA